jgi:DNA modification methylase
VSHRLIVGDALESLRTLPDCSVDCCVTSPPYWQQRQYGTEPQVWGAGATAPHQHEWGDQIPGDSRGGSGTGGNKRQVPHGDGRQTDSYAESRVPSPVNYGRDAEKGCFCLRCGAWRGELGQEPTVDLYMAHMVEIFTEVRRVLKKSGTCFVNIGDTRPGGARSANRKENGTLVFRGDCPGCSAVQSKSMALIPERLLIALADSGWIVRSKIIWQKPSAMPERATDRPTESYEPIYFLTKSPRYWSDFGAIREPAQSATLPWEERKAQGEMMRHGISNNAPSLNRNGKDRGKNAGGPRTRESLNANWEAAEASGADLSTRNIRNVWTFTNQGFSAWLCPNCQTVFTNVKSLPNRMVGSVKEHRCSSCDIWVHLDSHYAAFPPELPKRCILCGCPPDGVVLDPFVGTGTTMAVAVELGRHAIGIDLDPRNAEFVEKRLAAVTPAMRFEV